MKISTELEYIFDQIVVCVKCVYFSWAQTYKFEVARLKIANTQKIVEGSIGWILMIFIIWMNPFAGPFAYPSGAQMGLMYFATENDKEQPDIEIVPIASKNLVFETNLRPDVSIRWFQKYIRINLITLYETSSR